MRRAALAGALALAAGAPLEAQQLRVNVPLETLEAAAARDSCDAPTLVNLAMGYLSRNRWDSADTVLLRAATIDPQFAPAFFGLALVQERNRQYWDRLKREGGDSAVSRERRRREAFSRKAFLVDPMVDIRLIGAVIPRRDYPNVMVQAFNAIMDGDYQRAHGFLQLGYRFNVSSGGAADSLPPFFLWLHALTAARVGQYPAAISDVQALLRQSTARERSDSLQYMPLHTNDYRYMLGTLYQRAAQNTRAIQQLEQVLANDIGNYMAHVQLARIADAERDWFNAVRQRQRAVDVNPEDHTLQYDLGQTLLRAGRYGEAEGALLQARAMEPRLIRTHLALGIAQQELGKAEEARGSLTRFLALAPERFEGDIRDARERLARLQ